MNLKTRAYVSVGTAIAMAGFCLCGPAAAQTFQGSVTQDAFCDVVPSPCCNECVGAPALVLTIPGAEMSVAGDATITMEIFAELQDLDENFTVSVEGFDMGEVFNQNPDDDLFDVPGDLGTECEATITTTATIPQAQLPAIVDDGQIEISLIPRQDDSDIEPCGEIRETVTLTVEYPVDQVPTLPAALALVLLVVLLTLGAHLARSQAV